MCGGRYDGCYEHGAGGAPPEGRQRWPGAWLHRDEWQPQVNAAVLNAECLKQRFPFSKYGDENRYPPGNEFCGEVPGWKRDFVWTIEADVCVCVCVGHIADNVLEL